MSRRARIHLPATPSPRPHAKQSIDRYAQQRQQRSTITVPRAEPDDLTVFKDIWAFYKRTVGRIFIYYLDCVTDAHEPH